jgi:spore coat polysaccharide biosynthesis predicted glycosyltransferase SpsG
MIIFRTDASAKTGFGHLKRSTYLASLLKSKASILFCIGGDKTAGRYLEEKGFSSCSLKQLRKWENSSFEAVKSIVFDLRDFTDDDILLLRRAREGNSKTIQITDLGLSQHEVDYTVDSSLDPLFPYDPSKQLLSGAGYAILHNKFRHFNKVKRKYRKVVKNIFICFGGAVDYQRLRMAVDVLSRHRYNLKIAPGFYLKRSAVKTLKRIYPGIRFTGKTDNLARAFFEADVAFITSGVAAFEAAAVGTPAFYFYYHGEQKAIAQSFEKRGAGLVISNIDDLLEVGPKMIQTLKQLTPEERIQMGDRAKQLVDGKGVYRILDFLEKEAYY